MYSYTTQLAPQVRFAKRPVKPENVWSRYGKSATPKFIPG